jgi:DNA-binding MarR family transcriptional regulator
MIKIKVRLTERQFVVLKFIWDYVNINHFQPDLGDIGTALRISKSAVHDFVKALERKGWVSRHAWAPRAIRLSPEAVRLLKGQIPKERWVR